jgi:hypothetical protein
MNIRNMQKKSMQHTTTPWMALSAQCSGQYNPLTALERGFVVGTHGECPQDLLKLVDDAAAAQGVKD